MSDERGRRRRRLEDARLYLVSPARMRAGRLCDMIPALGGAGVDLVQLRDRSLGETQLELEAAACARAAAACGVLFIVNDLPELARAVDADGVHLGQDDGTIADARALLGSDRIIGRSTRGGDQLDEAAAEGADYGSVGPLWETPTKAGRSATGLARAAAAARAARIPWFAIGGIDERRLLRAAAVGARRVAVVRAVVDAEDPVAAARRLRARLLDSVPRVLSVAGSDSSGGAGMQADIKAIVRSGGFPTCAITAVTAQTTVGVRAVEVLSPRIVAEQIACAVEDIGVDAVKTGMLAMPEMIEAVADALRTATLEGAPIVVDPVLRAESGARLLVGGCGEEAYRRAILPLATVITPNLFEAQALAGDEDDDATRLAQTLHARHGCAVIVTGGHGRRSADVLCDTEGLVEIAGPRLPRTTTHGAGCTHSATLATFLAAGVPLREAAKGAKRAATRAVREGRPFGEGAGPVDVSAGRWARPY